MQYLKRNTKYSIFTFLIIVLSITISISTLAKTEVYFSLYDNPKILSITYPKPEVQPININAASQDKLMKILKISKPIAQKIVALREGLGGFKGSKDFLQLPEVTTLDWREWEEEGIVIIF